MGMGAVAVSGTEPPLRATGGSEEPLSISDTGDRAATRCWKRQSFMHVAIHNLLAITGLHLRMFK